MAFFFILSGFVLAWSARPVVAAGELDPMMAPFTAKRFDVSAAA